MSPDYVYLGSEFFLHYDLRVTLDYPAVRHVPEPGSHCRLLDPQARCGWVEKG